MSLYISWANTFNSVGFTGVSLVDNGGGVEGLPEGAPDEEGLSVEDSPFFGSSSPQ